MSRYVLIIEELLDEQEPNAPYKVVKRVELTLDVIDIDAVIQAARRKPRQRKRKDTTP